VFDTIPFSLSHRPGRESSWVAELQSISYPLSTLKNFELSPQSSLWQPSCLSCLLLYSTQPLDSPQATRTHRCGHTSKQVRGQSLGGSLGKAESATQSILYGQACIWFRAVRFAHSISTIARHKFWIPSCRPGICCCCRPVHAATWGSSRRNHPVHAAARGSIRQYSFLQPAAVGLRSEPTHRRALTGRSPAYPDYLARQPQYHHAPGTQAGGAAGMAQATSPSMTLNDGQQNDHRNNPSNIKSDADVPIDPSIAASSPTYPPPYSPYQPQGHDMTQYQGHPPPPPPPQMYARPEWSHGYQHQHGLPGPYTSPATTVGSASPAATAGPRPGQVRLLPFGAWFEGCAFEISAVLGTWSFICAASSRTQLGTSGRQMVGHVHMLTLCHRSTHLFPSPVPSSTSGLAVVMRRLSVCTSAGGMVVRRPMALWTIWMRM